MSLPYQISSAAAEDWSEIATYTLNNFGKKQVQKYTDGLLKCLQALSNTTASTKVIKVGEYQVICQALP